MAIEHELLADVDEIVVADTQNGEVLVQEIAAIESSACGPTAHDSLPRRAPDMLLILSRPLPVAQRRPKAG